MSTLLIFIELLVLLVVTRFVAVPNACGAGGGVWEHLCSGMDGVNLLWDDFAGSLVRNSVWTVAMGCSLSAGLSGLYSSLGFLWYCSHRLAPSKVIKCRNEGNDSLLQCSEMVPALSKFFFGSVR